MSRRTSLPLLTLLSIAATLMTSQVDAQVTSSSAANDDAEELAVLVRYSLRKHQLCGPLNVVFMSIIALPSIHDRERPIDRQ